MRKPLAACYCSPCDPLPSFSLSTMVVAVSSSLSKYWFPELRFHRWQSHHLSCDHHLGQRLTASHSRHHPPPSITLIVLVFCVSDDGGMVIADQGLKICFINLKLGQQSTWTVTLDDGINPTGPQWPWPVLFTHSDYSWQADGRHYPQRVSSMLLHACPIYLKATQHWHNTISKATQVVRSKNAGIWKIRPLMQNLCVYTENKKGLGSNLK